MTARAINAVIADDDARRPFAAPTSAPAPSAEVPPVPDGANASPQWGQRPDGAPSAAPGRTPRQRGQRFGLPGIGGPLTIGSFEHANPGAGRGLPLRRRTGSVVDP